MIDRHCYVYLIEADTGGVFAANDILKVGISESPFARLAQFSTASPHPLIMRQVWRFSSRQIAYDIEQTFHADHRDCRLNGEWFFTSSNGARCTLNDMALRYWVEILDKPIETAAEFLGSVGCDAEIIPFIIGASYGDAPYDSAAVECL